MHMTRDLLSMVRASPGAMEGSQANGGGGGGGAAGALARAVDGAAADAAAVAEAQEAAEEAGAVVEPLGGGSATSGTEGCALLSASLSHSPVEFCYLACSSTT